MANEEHLGIINQGASFWNRWRGEHLGTQPDLSGADLISTILRGANLSGAWLTLALSPRFYAIYRAEREAEVTPGFPFKARPTVIKPHRGGPIFLVVVLFLTVSLP